MALWPKYGHDLNQNSYKPYFNHQKPVCSVRKKITMVFFGNCKNGPNPQNGPKMAKILKMQFFTEKVAFKYIWNYVFTF